MHTTAELDALIVSTHMNILHDTLKNTPSTYARVFRVMDMNRKTESFPQLGGTGLWSQNTEGAAFNESTFSKGDTVTFTALRFDNSYKVTHEMVEDDLYGVLQGMGVGMNGLATDAPTSAQLFARGLVATIDTLAANVINNGFANTGFDGVALFSNSHPTIDTNGEATTVDTLLTGGISPTTLQSAYTQMIVQVGKDGIKLDLMPSKITVANNIFLLTQEIVGSALKAQTGNNDKNVLGGLEVVPWVRLDSGVWMLTDGSQDNLVFKWRERPMFGSERIQGTMDRKIFGYTRCIAGYNDFVGMVGSAG